MDFYCIPKCTTCAKARKWLDQEGISYNEINLKEETPSKETMVQFLENTDRTRKSFFNTSGDAYRSGNLKDKIDDLSLEETAELLASDGMLIKRPLMIDGDTFTNGFKEEVYENTWK